MISVCIATYNGEKYIREQVDSILSQLGPDDELVVCDDQSGDRTLEILVGYHDTRIRAYRNETRLGHVRNFEKAISLARGDYIFLSDQDDVWLPGRVAAMLERMAANPRALLVASNFDLIDEAGAGIGEFRLLGPVKPFWLMQLFYIFAGKQPYWGCTFLMRRKILDYCMPIPERIESHDIWIALIASVFGTVVNIHGATLQHRMHGRNVTVKKSRALRVILWSRYYFLRALVLRAFSLRFKIH